MHLIGGGMTLLTGVLIITDYIELRHMLIIALIQGFLMATQIPASNSLAYQIVGPQRLLNAMATRLMAMNMSRIIGSLIAGVLITRYGVGSSYLFAAAGSLFGLGFLWFVKGSFQASTQREPFLQATSQGHEVHLGGHQYPWTSPAQLIHGSVCFFTPSDDAGYGARRAGRRCYWARISFCGERDRLDLEHPRGGRPWRFQE